MIDEFQRAADALDKVNMRERLELEELYRLGGLLTTITGQLDKVCDAIEKGISELPEDRVYDDEGHDPQLRLDEAASALYELESGTSLAHQCARDYHAAISHIGIVEDGS